MFKINFSFFSNKTQNDVSKREFPFVPPTEGVYFKYYNHSNEELSDEEMTELLLHIDKLGKDIDPYNPQSSKVIPDSLVGTPGYLLREIITIYNRVEDVKREFTSYNANYGIGPGNDISIWIHPSFTISDKGIKYNEEELQNIYSVLVKNHIPKPQPDKDFNPFEGLSEDKLKEISDYKIKIRASRWKSTQRSLRKKGKLEQYKIDSLNKLGMVWNPREDTWEKTYLSFIKRGFCYGLEKWIDDQRKLYSDKKLSKENLHRLQAINFKFQPQDNEGFPIGWGCYNELNDKFSRKRDRLKRANSKFKKPNKQEIKDKKKQNDSNKTLNNYYNRRRSVKDSFDSKLIDLSNDELIDKIKKIISGKSMYYESYKLFYKEIVDSKVFKGWYGNPFKLDSEGFTSDIDNSSKYFELMSFNKTEINPLIREMACNYMLDYFKEIGSNHLKSFQPLEYLISFYKKEKNTDELKRLKKYIEKYPLLIMLYEIKINNALLEA